MSRHIWVVRHGERADNINLEWGKTAPRGAWDDPPLTIRGLQQAQEVGQKLIQENQKIDHIFSSPFTRCMQTVSNIIKEINKSQVEQLKIKIEPGFSEALNACQEPPGCLSVDELRNDFTAIEENYKPFISVENLPQETTPVCCFNRVKNTLDYILSQYSGNILIVSHGSPIAGCHIVFTGQFQYVGQCTISKYVMDENTNLEDTQTDKYFCEYAGDSSHLSNQTNLRDVINITKELKQMISKHVKI